MSDSTGGLGNIDGVMATHQEIIRDGRSNGDTLWASAALCFSCWAREEPGRVAHTISADHRKIEICYSCHKLTASGIYARRFVRVLRLHAGPRAGYLFYSRAAQVPVETDAEAETEVLGILTQHGMTQLINDVLAPWDAEAPGRSMTGFEVEDCCDEDD